MSEADPFAPADPIEGLPRPERVNYATGVLLDAEDFVDEQSYHRARLATALKSVVGFGTVAGLRVRPPAEADPERELHVDPGVAIDRFGRLIELAEPWCIRITRWFDAQATDVLESANQGGADPLMYVDVFLSARNCALGKTPAFATGPFDALDAVVASRISEGASLELVIRAEPGTPPLPKNYWPSAGASNADKLAAVLGSWNNGVASGSDQLLDPLEEHVNGHDPSALFLARVTIPLDVPASPPGARVAIHDTRPISVDNGARPFVYLPNKWLGDGFTAEPLIQPEP